MQKIVQINNYNQEIKNKFIDEYGFKRGLKVVEENGTLTAYAETEEELIKKRKAQFEKEYFYTSLGWVSRKVHMQTDEVWDFLKDIAKPELLGREIITYTPNEDYSDLEQHRNVVVTEQFLKECDLQVYKDFYGA